MFADGHQSNDIVYKWKEGDSSIKLDSASNTLLNGNGWKINGIPKLKELAVSTSTGKERKFTRC